MQGQDGAGPLLEQEASVCPGEERPPVFSHQGSLPLSKARFTPPQLLQVGMKSGPRAEVQAATLPFHLPLAS